MLGTDKVYNEGAEAATRLNELGISEEVLQTAVKYGTAQAAGCTTNDPPILRGFTTWGKTVRGLRDELLPVGWSKDDSRNYSTVIDPTGSFAIAVASGDAATGVADSVPSTRSEKGPVTRDAIERNVQGHFSEIDPDEFPAPTKATRETWFLLYYEDQEANEIRMELSQPASMTTDGVVTAWLERIVVAPLPTGATVSIDNTEDESYEADVRKRSR